LADNDISQVQDYDGGSSGGGGIDLPGGSSAYPSSPIAGELGSTGNNFFTNYSNIAKIKNQLSVIDATFKRFNTPPVLNFSGNTINISRKAETLDTLNISEFFHPLLDFSEYQKQTFVISPRTTVNIDPSSLQTTNGEVSMIVARAYYLPEASYGDRSIFWDYKGSQRNPMGQFMVLSGAVKDGSSWYGWDLDPFTTYGHTGPANIANGGISFTNPTNLNVKLTIIIAS